MPSGLEGRFRTAGFWRDFLFVDESAVTQWEPWDVRFVIAPELPSLLLSADATGYLSLVLEAGSQAFEVAWDDLAHWHPHVLRWSELDAVCRRVEASSPVCSQPGLALLLLARFAPMVTSADSTLALPLLEEAWRGLGPAAPEAEAHLRQLIDLRAAGVRWRTLPQGWCLEQSEAHGGPQLYSLRVEGNPDFPWTEWREFSNGIGAA